VRVLGQVPAGKRTLESILPEEELYLEFVRQHRTRCSLFTSMHGHIGAGPKELGLGDFITAWLGCDFAMVIIPDLT
jgi:hypothetical protein